MNKNPVNLGVRFLLELIILAAFGMWGWHLFVGWEQYAAALILPAIAATLWGIFRIPNDPGAAPVKTPGLIRLLMELGLFALTVWILFTLNYITLSYIIAAIVIVHYTVSYDRTWAMLRNKPYNGFVK
ncbi:YrdB family protein [Mucilaginibacter sp. X5P1]|uniref:YrdB family protein n=1 Tax=Mucilaginibacter sp. X5P1 TaxID=2723088 RepID=UPI001615EA38|nr:YrdB family protein [Mucilaginibacter sp. X5P1]MBB6140000.1 hypothetical protein [Mucilaginibacter sp. X5P1]